jgi:hypothetical protein
MSRFTLFLLFTLMSTCLLAHATDRAIGVQGIVPPAIRASEGFNPAESAGLFVGIRTFKDEGFAEVPFAVDDAIDLAHLFALELDLVAPENVTLALAGDPQKPTSAAHLQALLQAGAIHASASKFQILRHLKKRRLATSKRGLFIVALATHGFNHQGRDFLVGADTVHDFIQDTGISRRFEGPAATMPLAIDLSAMPALASQSSEERYEAALQKLYANVDFRGPITGRLADEVAQVLLSPDLAADWREALLSELETLDGSLRGKRIFADSYYQRRHWFGVGNGAQQSHQKTSAPLPSPPISQGEATIAKFPSQPAAYTLTVRADPPDSRIRVMNIRPSYKPKMSLPPGEYDILVDHQGYNSARQWVTIRDQDVVIDMRLDPR